MVTAIQWFGAAWIGLFLLMIIRLGLRTNSQYRAFAPLLTTMGLVCACELPFIIHMKLWPLAAVEGMFAFVALPWGLYQFFRLWQRGRHT